MIKLDDNVRQRIKDALDTGKSLTAAYVDRDGKPHISFYGSTHVHNDDELAIWVRKPDSELLKTIPDNPHISMIYGDIPGTFYATFEGRARVETDPVERDRIYAEMHDLERKFEPDKAGFAVVIKLDRVTLLSKADGKQVFEA